LKKNCSKEQIIPKKNPQKTVVRLWHHFFFAGAFFSADFLDSGFFAAAFFAAAMWFPPPTGKGYIFC
jgi:hypothetical protein